MSLAQVAIAPMRAQPFHFGHEYYLQQLSTGFKRVVVLLNRKQDFDNPFTLSQRRFWMMSYCELNSLTNVSIPERLELSKSEEYGYYGGKSFVVITTNETEEMYSSIGFNTFNHHQKQLPVPANAESLPGYWWKQKSDAGRIIRSLLRKRITCSKFMSQTVELAAASIINS